MKEFISNDFDFVICY